MAEFDDLLGSLKRAAAALRDADVSFLLGGVLAVWARGGPETEHDLDFMVKPEDADRALEAFAAAGVPYPADALAPLANATLHNALSGDPIGALTGPAVRGDVGTVERNLIALRDRAPELVGPYIVLAELALDLLERSGREKPPHDRAVREVLAKWR